MKYICVFAGSRDGVDPDYRRAAVELGSALARRGIGLVYGGASVGLMGALADAVLVSGGEVIGVIPDALVARELSHDGLTDLRIVGSMHERKALMVSLSDGFIALPGGLGTLDELFEILTWAQLGLHRKPCGVLNAAGYYDRLLAFVGHAVEQDFVSRGLDATLAVDTDAESLIERLASCHGQRASNPHGAGV